jgi:hypothetical protein
VWGCLSPTKHKSRPQTACGIVFTSAFLSLFTEVLKRMPGTCRRVSSVVCSHPLLILCSLSNTPSQDIAFVLIDGDFQVRRQPASCRLEKTGSPPLLTTGISRDMAHAVMALHSSKLQFQRVAEGRGNRSKLLPEHIALLFTVRTATSLAASIPHPGPN